VFSLRHYTVRPSPLSASESAYSSSGWIRILTQWPMCLRTEAWSNAMNSDLSVSAVEIQLLYCFAFSIRFHVVGLPAHLPCFGRRKQFYLGIILMSNYLYVYQSVCVWRWGCLPAQNWNKKLGCRKETVRLLLGTVLAIYTVFQRSDAKIQITITTAHLIRINYPLSSFNYRFSDTNVANFNKIHHIVSEQQL